MLNRVRITRKATFEAAHHLPNHYGKCANLHGHSYKLEVTVSGCIDAEALKSIDVENKTAYLNPEIGMVLDFGTLKTHMKMITDRYDHSNLNDYFRLPTAEIMAVSIFKELQEGLKNYDLRVESVKLWETEGSYAEYRGEEE